MGDYSTLHLFNDRKFFKQVVPRLKQSSIKELFTSDLDLYIGGFDIPRDQAIQLVQTLISDLSADLKTHPELLKLETVNFKADSDKDVTTFVSQNSIAIEAYQCLILGLIFPKYANYHPHLEIGKYQLSSYVKTVENSTSSELIEKISKKDAGSVFDRIDGGITNWLTADEVKKLHADNRNITQLEDFSFCFTKLKELLKMAHQKRMGLILLRNSSESNLSKKP